MRGVDRTFNISSLFLTLTVFKNQSVLRSNTMRPPISIGPMFLHGDGKFVTYLQFFLFLRGVLDTDVHASEVKMLDGIVTGSDEEAALVKALRTAFPTSKHLFCALHCEDNVREHLTKSGVQVNIREHILRSLFGSCGISASTDECMFEDRCASHLHCSMYARTVQTVSSTCRHALFQSSSTTAKSCGVHRG